MLFNNFMILVKFDVGRPSPFWPPLLYGLCKNYRKLALKFWKIWTLYNYLYADRRATNLCS